MPAITEKGRKMMFEAEPVKGGHYRALRQENNMLVMREINAQSGRPRYTYFKHVCIWHQDI